MVALPPPELSPSSIDQSIDPSHRRMAKKKRQRSQDEEEEAEEDAGPLSEEPDGVRKPSEDKHDSDDDEDANAMDTADEEESDEESAVLAPSVSEASPFLDAFYSLAATDPRERAAAAQTILLHVQATPVEAPYAWKRLLRGLGSGRAAARQGNASALAALIKLGAQSTLLQTLRESDTSVQTSESPLDYVRQALLQATQLPTGKHKGSEERDALFGRLFGMVAVIRSGLLTGADQGEVRPWLVNLAELYRAKRWMREPAAHAVCLLLQTTESTTTRTVLIREVVLVQFLAQGDHKQREGGKSTSVLATYSAEQVALSLYCQQQVMNLPAPLDQPLLSIETVPILAPILASTSHVTQPRTHLVWDVLALVLTSDAAPTGDGDNKSPVVEQRSLRPEMTEIFSAVYTQVLVNHLIQATEEKPKATENRRALALCLVRQWAGVEFMSSISGRIQVHVPAAMLESVILQPILVRRLLSDLASSKDHYLKPLANLVLQQVTEEALSSLERRLAVLRACLTADARFDASSKSAIVATLFGWLHGDAVVVKDYKATWEAMVDFIFDRIRKVGQERNITTYEATGLIDLLFHHGKFLLRVHKDDSTAGDMVRRVLGFFMTTAFFDCGEITVKKKDKKIPIALMAQKAVAVLPYDLRCVLASRFYSLLAERMAVHLRVAGLSAAVAGVQEVLNDWKGLNSIGAVSLGSKSEEANDEDEEEMSVGELVGTLQTFAEEILGADDKAKRGMESFIPASYMLSMGLYLNTLSCGTPDNVYDDDDPDSDELGDKEESESFIRDLHDVVEQFQGNSERDEAEDDGNPLTSLAALCVNILSSPLASGSPTRGGSPKVLRDAVRQIWVHGMMAAAHAEFKADSDVLTILLDALGAKAEEDQDTIAGDPDNAEEDEDMEGDDDEVDATIFSKAASVVNSDEEMKDDDEGANEKEEIAGNDEEEEIELDHTRLQSLLAEDDDASVDAEVLEHHAGADAALARLIQMKQNARKAGQKAREKIDISNNIRCVVLLETLVKGKPEGWGSLLSPHLVLSSISPLLDRCRYLERDLARLTGKAQNSAGEKRALLEKITAMLQQRILKCKMGTFPSVAKGDTNELILELSQRLMSHARHTSSRDHHALVSTALVFVIRSLPTVDEQVDTARTIYSDAVEEWSTKGASRLDSLLFEELLRHTPQIAQMVLPQQLAKAASDGRYFIKVEAFRLLALLFNPSLSPGDREIEKTATEAMKTSVGIALDSVALALSDSEMTKAKRAREVLKALEQIIVFMEATEFAAMPSIAKVRDALASCVSDSESPILKSSCEEMASRLQALELIVGEKGDEANENVGDAKKFKKAKKKKGKKKH
jgi:DNA polymerase phi